MYINEPIGVFFMSLSVQKYSGKTLGNIEKIKEVALFIKKHMEMGKNLVVVVSAMGDTTDRLLEMAGQISEDPDKRELAVLMTSGEQVSIALLTIALHEIGVDAMSMTGPQIGLMTSGSHTRSVITDLDEKVILEKLAEGKVVIVAGFQGVNEENEITTLGRGGSDTTAVALAARLGCPCELFADIDGVYTVNPNYYPNARKLAEISYDEMLEMATAGADIVNSRAIELAQRYKVPLSVSLSGSDYPGTIIKEMESNMESTAITGIAINNDEAMISITGIPNDMKTMADLFEKMADKYINIDMISQTMPKNKLVSLSFTIEKGDIGSAKKLLDEFAESIDSVKYEIVENICKLSVMGLGMLTQSGVAAKLFRILADHHIEVSTITTSEIKISYVIAPEDQRTAVEAIAQEFNL